MSAEDQGSSTTPIPAADPGPVEIVFATKAAPQQVAEPVKQAVEAPKVDKSGADAAGETDDGTEGEGDHSNSTPRVKNGVQGRIGEITKARRAAEREADYWKARALGTTSAQSPAQTAAQPKPPVQADFATPEEFQTALDDFNFDQRVDKKVEEKLTTKSKQDAAHADLVERVTSWQAQMDEARQAYPDLDEVLDNAELPISPHIVELLVDHNKGAVLARHLALAPEELAKLNTMSTAKAAIHLAEIALSIKAPTQTSDSGSADAGSTGKPTKSVPADSGAPAPRSVSKAPPPASTLGQGRATAPTLEDLPMEDYIARRKSQGASWAR